MVVAGRALLRTGSISRSGWTRRREPVGAVVFIDWTRAWECVVIVVPSRAAELIPTMWAHAVEHADSVGDRRLRGSGAGRRPRSWSACHRSRVRRHRGRGEPPPGWTPPNARRSRRSLTATGSPTDPTQGDRPHHMVGRSGADVAARLAQTSLYRPDLDLSIETVAGEVVVLRALLVRSGHQGRDGGADANRGGPRGEGTCPALLLSGLERLAGLGATRLRSTTRSGTHVPSACISVQGSPGSRPSPCTRAFSNGWANLRFLPAGGVAIG